MKKIEKFKSLVFYFLFGFLFLAYLLIIIENFQTSLDHLDSIFGYIDFQHNWRGLEDFVNLKTPFKDYFYEYGWFFLFLQSPAYLIFGRTFLAVLVSRILFLPALAVFLSLVIAKNVLKKKLLILIFLFLCLLFGTNYDFTSIRHLSAELSLSFLILFLLRPKGKKGQAAGERYLLVSGVLAGLAVLTALEYGVALNLTAFGLFLATLLPKLKINRRLVSKFLIGEGAVLFPFFSWLFLNGAVKNYWQFTYGFIKNFYYASPCGGQSFPRLSEITSLTPGSKLIIFDLPIELLQRLNFYLVFIFYIVVGLILVGCFLVKRSWDKKDLVKLSLTTYGGLIFLRTLDSPCLGYFVYGLIPFFLLFVLVIEDLWRWQRKRSIFLKAGSWLVIILAIFWLVATENTGYFVKIFGKKEEAKVEQQTFQEEFYPPVGLAIKKDLAQGYREIADYVEANSSQKDFLYVYPWGPFNNITGRPPPNSLTNALQFAILGDEFKKMAVEELREKKPKLVVVYLRNNLGIVHWGKSREDVARYFSLEDKEGPVFSGEGNEIEKYILENYEEAFKNDVAVVMNPREEPITISVKKKEIAFFQDWEEERVELQSMKKTDLPGRYKITGKKASWSLVLAKPIQAKEALLEFKLDGNIFTKHLTRYLLNFYLKLSVSGGEEFTSKDLARKDWQKVPLLLKKESPIREVKIEIGKNTGLIWWLNPGLLEIRKITFFK